MIRRNRNKYSKKGNELKEHYFKRIIKMLIDQGDYSEDDAFEKCQFEWTKQLSSYLKVEDRFLRDAF